MYCIPASQSIYKCYIIGILKFTQCQKFPTRCHFGPQKFLFVASTEGKQQSPHAADGARGDVDGAAESKKLFHWIVQMQHSEATSAKWYCMPLTHSPPATPPPPSSFNWCVFVFLSKCLLKPGFFSALSLPSSSIQVLQLTKPPFYRSTKEAMYFFVSCLFPGLAHVLAVCRSPRVDIPHTSLQSSSRLQ